MSHVYTSLALFHSTVAARHVPDRPEQASAEVVRTMVEESGRRLSALLEG